MPRSSSEPNAVSYSTEPVSTITYQPRMTVSISNASDVRRSAGHWKRKLRTRNAAGVRAETCRQPASRSIADTSSAESVRSRLARSCFMWAASEVPVSGSMPTASANRNTT